MQANAWHALRAIKHVTGHQPSTCPWRAYYDPLVIEVMSASWAVEGGNLDAVIGSDPPNVLVEAIGIYRMSMLATIAEDRRLQEERNKKR